MKRTLTLLLVLALLTVPFTGLAAEEEKVLNIYTWATYIDEDTLLKPFTEETGIQINYSTFNSNEEMLEKLSAVKGGEYDIILASDYVLSDAREQGLLLPLDKEKIPNYSNIYERFLNQYYDPTSEYTVPYIAGTPLIVYDPARVDFEITGYNDLWRPELAHSVTLMDDARNVIGITLKSLGYSFNTTDPEELAEAQAKLMELKPNIAVLDYDGTYVHIVSGEATVGYMFTPFIVMALMERPDLKVVYPEEGMGFGIDSLVIPVNAPHPDNAHLFLDYLLRPESGVAIAEVQKYRNVNEASEPLLPDSYWDNPAQNIPDELLGNFEYIEYLGADESIFQDMWVEFKQK